LRGGSGRDPLQAAIPGRVPSDDASCQPSVRPCKNDVTPGTAAKLIDPKQPLSALTTLCLPPPPPQIICYANESKPVPALHFFTHGLPGNRKFGQLHGQSNLYCLAVCILRNDQSKRTRYSPVHTRTIQSLPITIATKTPHKPKASTLTITSSRCKNVTTVTDINYSPAHRLLWMSDQPVAQTCT
jgi:hypothetical protein